MVPQFFSVVCGHTEVPFSPGLRCQLFPDTSNGLVHIANLSLIEILGVTTMFFRDCARACLNSIQEPQLDIRRRENLFGPAYLSILRGRVIRVMRIHEMEPQKKTCLSVLPDKMDCVPNNTFCRVQRTLAPDGREIAGHEPVKGWKPPKQASRVRIQVIEELHVGKAA